MYLMIISADTLVCVDFQRINIFIFLFLLIGFENTDDACCHVLGKHGGLMGCPSYADVCPDRNKFVFWDGFHPSEETYEIVANRILDGDVAQIEPMNVRQLLKAKTY